MALKELGRSALVGWRKPVGERLAKPLEEKTALSGDQARSIVGAAFFVLSVIYVAGTLKRLVEES